MTMQTRCGRVLVADSDSQTVAHLDALFSSSGFLVDACTSMKRFKELFKQLVYDAVIVNLDLDADDGLQSLAHILRLAPCVPIFVLGSDDSVSKAVACMQRGASGYFLRGSAPQRVLDAVKRALAERLPLQVTPAVQRDQYGLVGRSEAIQHTLSTIERIQQVDSTVLILGESGTGKDVVARAIHASSSRAAERFEAINCGAIPESLLETELFGHVRGAFTDAHTDHKGIFEVCSKGSLLLDEVGDMPLILQTKILRVLQERCVLPVGASASIPVNTRLLAATHRDILGDMRDGQFREDLFYRLSVVVLHIPPLRERKEDIPLLVNYFLERLNHRFDRNVRAPTGTTLERILSYDWPGNVRELQNAIERAVGLADSDVMSVDDLFPQTRKTDHAWRSGVDRGVDREIISLPLTQAKKRFEKSYLQHLLQLSGGNVSETARISGRYRSDIYRLMHRHALEQSGFR